MSDEPKLKPMFIVKPKTMSRRDIARVEKGCGVIIVECADPDSARYSEAPLGANLDVQARAALDLMRWVIRHDGSTYITKATMTAFLLDSLLLHSRPSDVPAVKSVKK